MTESEREEKKAALQRYESARREHLGGAINLIFGLSAAASGFCLSRVLDADTQVVRPGSGCFTAAALLLLLAVGLSIACTWTRLQDFRLTARKLRRELRGADAEELKRLGAQTNALGRWTWRLFYLQLSAFAAGILLLAIALILLNSKHVGL